MNVEFGTLAIEEFNIHYKRSLKPVKNNNKHRIEIIEIFDSLYLLNDHFFTF